jgi:lipopolysaccharide export LptBFGC system permease protein LptF
VQICMTDVVLTTRLWLKVPTKYKDVPRYQIIAHALTNLRPSQQVLDKFLAYLRSSVREGKITEERATQLQFSEFINGVVALESDNNVNKLDDEAAENIIERVIAIQRARDEEIHSRVRVIVEKKDDEIARLIETYEQKIDTLNKRIESREDDSLRAREEQRDDEGVAELEQLREDISARTTAHALQQSEDSVNTSRSLSPITVLKAALKEVPAVKYALGVAGVAAACAIVVGFLGTGRTAIILLGGMLVSMILLFVFAKLVTVGNQAAARAGVVLMWAVTIFFCVFLLFTTTAVAVSWPSAWVAVLGLPRA